MASASAPVVYVVDDDISVREALPDLLREIGYEARVFASAEEFLARPQADGPSCLILDLELPDLSGLELQERIAAEQREMPIVFLTGYGDIPRTVRAMKAGAAEFLTKPFSADVLLDAVEHALDRSRAALEDAAELSVLRARYATLTPREREVMGWVVAGLLNKQVGAALGTSEITVKAHRGRVMLKMQAESLPDLVRIASRLELPLPANTFV